MPVDTKNGAVRHVTIAGQDVEYRLRPVRRSHKLRVRVDMGGVEVLQPISRPYADIEMFLQDNGAWLLAQLDRLARLHAVRRVKPTPIGQILFGGTPTHVHVENVLRRAGSNQVQWRDGQLLIVRGRSSRLSPAGTLENWLRRQARAQIAPLVDALAERLAVVPGRLYIMDQQTKWGNCSAIGNLSFNWRMVMAPTTVLEYLVTHEVVHLVIPDHSQKFWLTVQSLCPESERARQWLCANAHRLLVDLPETVNSVPAAQ